MDNLNRPQYQYARLVSKQTFSDYIKMPFKSTYSLVTQGVNKKTITDYELSTVKNPLALGGGLIIATLATLGRERKAMGIRHGVGLAAWVAALIYGPKVINAIVQLKSGINLNKDYVDTYGNRYGLFDDPRYLPLQLLSEEELNNIGDRLNIPYGVDRKRQIEDKVRQISVQAQTWWNLIVGAAVPITAMGVVNSASTPIMGFVSSIKAFYHNKAGSFLNPMPSEMLHHLDGYVEEKLGRGANSWSLRWRSNFEHKLVTTLGLDKLFKPKEVLKASDEKLMGRLVDYFSKLSDVPENRQTLDNVLNLLGKERRAIDGLENDILQALSQYKKLIKKSLEKSEDDIHNFGQNRVKRILMDLYRRKGNALSEILHYETLFEQLQQRHLSVNEVRYLTEKPVIGEVERLIKLGRIEDARKLTVEDPELFSKVYQLLKNKSQRGASELLGDSPRSHLLHSMRNVAAKKIWRRRMIGYIGGGMAIATFLFESFILGRDFGPPSPKGRTS